MPSPFTALLCVISLSKKFARDEHLSRQKRCDTTRKNIPRYEKGKTAHEHSSHVIFPIEKLLKQEHTGGESFAEASQRFCSEEGKKLC